MAGSAFIVNRRSKRAQADHPPQGRFVTSAGVRLHYVEEGDDRGRPVVFLHGNSGMIDDLLISGVVDQAARRYRSIAFDRPGFGYSDRPGGRSWIPEAQAAVLREA